MEEPIIEISQKSGKYKQVIWKGVLQRVVRVSETDHDHMSRLTSNIPSSGTLEFMGLTNIKYKYNMTDDACMSEQVMVKCSKNRIGRWQRASKSVR